MSTILLSQNAAVAIVALVMLFFFGALILFGVRRGWTRNGYFSTIATMLAVAFFFLTFQAVGSAITIQLTGGHIEEHRFIALAVNGLAEITVLLAGAYALTHGARQHVLAIFRLEGLRETPISAYFLAVPIIFMAQIAGSAISTLWVRAIQEWPLLYHWLDHYETMSNQGVERMVTATSWEQLIFILAFVALTPALAEEALFRGFAQTNIERSGRLHTRPIFALIVASIMFAGVHASVFKFPGLFALGLALGWMTFRTNNLFVGGFGHAINNGAIVIALFASPSVTNSTSGLVSGELQPMQALLALAVSLPLLFGTLFAFKRATESLTARHNAEEELQKLIAQRTGLSAFESAYDLHHDEAD